VQWGRDPTSAKAALVQFEELQAMHVADRDSGSLAKSRLASPELVVAIDVGHLAHKRRTGRGDPRLATASIRDGLSIPS
jgi:hypothetical protein